MGFKSFIVEAAEGLGLVDRDYRPYWDDGERKYAYYIVPNACKLFIASVLIGLFAYTNWLLVGHGFNVNNVDKFHGAFWAILSILVIVIDFVAAIVAVLASIVALVCLLDYIGVWAFLGAVCDKVSEKLTFKL